jgi:hypothetical protein
MTLSESEISFNRGRGVSISDQVCFTYVHQSKKSLLIHDNQ